MSNPDLVLRYNYDEFVPENFKQWLKFENSPSVGAQAPDFPLWYLDGQETRLSEIWSSNRYTIVEFGSFT
jgi:hypothetical protein